MHFLYRGILESHIQLDPEHRDPVLAKVQELASKGRLAELLSFLPAFSFFVLPPLFSRYGGAIPPAVQILIQLGYMVAVVTIVVVLLRRRYRRYAVRAVVELGFADLCLKCGYDLSGSRAELDRCPECGQRAAPPPSVP